MLHVAVPQLLVVLSVARSLMQLVDANSSSNSSTSKQQCAIEYYISVLMIMAVCICYTSDATPDRRAMFTTRYTTVVAKTCKTCTTATAAAATATAILLLLHCDSVCALLLAKRAYYCTTIGPSIA